MKSARITADLSTDDAMRIENPKSSQIDLEIEFESSLNRLEIAILPYPDLALGKSN